MIERAKTKKNQEALKFDGRWLCSSVDAKAEAVQWAAAQRAVLRHHEHVVVLGAGCGYHLVELLREFPHLKVLALDTLDECIKFSETHHSLDLANLKMATFTETGDLFDSPHVKKWLSGEYIVLKYKPAWITATQAFEEAMLFLTARTGTGLQFLFSQRPDLQAEFRKIHESLKEYVSIKTLESRFSGAADSEVGHMLKLLRELVN